MSTRPLPSPTVSPVSCPDASLFPALLLREYCLLAAMAGIVAMRFPGPGLVFLASVLVLFLARTLSSAGGEALNPGGQKSLARSLARPLSGALVLVLLCAALGFGYARWRVVKDAPPAEPPWLVALLDEEDSVRPARAARMSGRVVQVDPLGPGVRQVLLQGLYPERAAFPQERGAEPVLEQVPELASGQVPEQVPELVSGLAPEDFFRPYTGRVRLTLYGHDGPLYPGQSLTGTFRLTRIRGYVNEGVFDRAMHLRDRGIRVRGTNTRASALQVEGEGEFMAVLREALRLRFLAALPQGSEGDNPLLPESMAQDSQEGQAMAAGELAALSGSAASPAAEQNAGPVFREGFAHLYGTPQAMLPALIFGERDLLSDSQQELVRHATLYHSLSLSGLHLGYAVAIGFVLARGLACLLPNILLYCPRPKLGVVLALPLALAYLWLGQAPVSLLRAALMLFFTALLLFANRPRVLLDGLFAALCAIFLYNPLAMFDLSLQLSALSMAVIALYATPLLGLCQSVLPVGQDPATAGRQFWPESPAGPAAGPWRASMTGLVQWSKKALRVGLYTIFLSAAIQVALAPLLAKTFGSMSLWFPLNALWLPVLGAIVMPGAFLGLALSALGLGAAANFFLTLATWPCTLLFALLETMDRIGILAPSAILRPHWSTCAGFWLLCILLPPLLVRLSRRPACPPSAGLFRRGLNGPLLALVLLAASMTLAPIAYGYYRYNTQPVSVRLLDVGQGQAVLVTWPGGRALVDGGGIGGGRHGGGFDMGQQVIAPALADNRPARVDWLIATHPDFDHLSGLIHPLEFFDVQQGFASNGGVAVPYLAAQLEAALKARPDVLPQVWSAGPEGPARIPLGPEGLYFEVLWPPAGAITSENAHKDSNAHSLVLRLVWQGRGLALLCGDVGKTGQNALVRKYGHGPEGSGLEAQILVLPHHGAKSSLVPALYDAVAPELALAGSGYKNQWGFPSQAVREALAERGIPLLSTAEQGEIVVQWDRDGVMRQGE